MKIDKDELKKALAIAVKFCEKKSTMPVLTCVLIDGEKGTLQATDLEYGCILPLKITDVEKVSSDPDKEAREEFAAELGEFKVSQLRVLAEDCEIEIPAKAKSSVIIEKIMEYAHSEKSREPLRKPTETGTRIGLNAHSLKRIVDSLDETGLIEFKVEPHKVAIGRHFHEIATFPHDEFPICNVLEEMEDPNHAGQKKSLRVGGAILKCGDLERVIPAATKVDDDHYRLHGVFFDKENNRAITTDGHRLHLVPADVQVPGKEKGFMVGTDFFKKLPTGKEDDDLVIEAFGSGNDYVVNVQVRIDDAQFIARAMDVKVPDYNAVIPKKTTHKVSILRKDVMVALRQAMVLSEGGSRAAKFTFNGGIDVSTVNPDTGMYERSKIPMKGHVDPMVTIGLNLRYLIDALPGKGDDDEFTVELTDGQHPVLFKRNNFTALVMPMRL